VLEIICTGKHTLAAVIFPTITGKVLPTDHIVNRTIYQGVF